MNAAIAVRFVTGVALTAALVAALPAVARAVDSPTALAPFDAVLDGRTELVGAAVAPDGTAYVSDRAAGIVYRIANGTAPALVTNLDRPAGLALDAEGRLLIAEEQAGRILRREADGALTTLATGIKTPRWLAINPDGSVYVSAHRLTAPDGADTTEGREIVRLVPGQGMTVVATGLRKLEGLVRVNGHLVAATQGLASGAGSSGMLLRFAVNGDGTLGAPTTWVATGLKQPVGVVADVLHAIYASSKELTTEEDREKRAIGKVGTDAQLTEFGASFGDPQGLALGPDGALYLADGKGGRLLRFAAPAPPAVTAPEVTNETALALTGTTAAGARVDLFVNETTTGVSATADTAGAFTLALTLGANATTTLTAYATAHGGAGLTSAAAEATVVHDGLAPEVTIDAPPPGTHVRGTVAVAVTATDAASQVASVALTVDAQPLGSTTTPVPPASPVTASATWDTATSGDGAHTLAATATDRAGNTTTAIRTVTVDNTPPDTAITAGPAPVVSTRDVTLAFTGLDNLTPVETLTFAWRLDGGAWSAFGPATSVTLTALSEAAHTVEVKARDLAGNEDPTPAAQTFTVQLGPAITTVTPATGPIGTLVTIAGRNFEPGATTVAFNGIGAVIRTVTATEITTTVPIGATTGALGVTTARGTGSAPFTVERRRDFTLDAAPATVPAVPGVSATVAVRTTATGGTGDLITLATGTLPSGVTVSFTPAVAVAGDTALLALQASATTPAGTHPITIVATARIDGVTVTRTATVTLDVRAPGQTVLVGQVRDGSERPLAGVRVLLGGTTLTPLGESDAGGNLVLTLGVSGPQTIVIDGSVLNTPEQF